MLQRRSWPPTAEPRAALLMLDESSAGAEVGVIWDATRARSEQCNTCFEKSGRLPVHLGLDHAYGVGILLCMVCGPDEGTRFSDTVES